MTFRKADWLYLLGAGLVVLLVSLLPSPKDRNPPVPATSAHQAVKMEHDCLRCHAPAGERPLPDRHPKRTDCLRCHRGLDNGGGAP